jgi:hypothetical protein
LTDKANKKADAMARTVKLVTRELPLEIGAVQVDDEGRLTARDRDAPLRFRFVYAEVPFAAEVSTGQTPLVRLAADFGALPYTIESPAARRWTLRLIQASAARKRGRLELTRDKEIRLRAEAVPPAPYTPVSIMATVTALLLDFKPMLELLGELLAAGLPRHRPAGPMPEARG